MNGVLNWLKGFFKKKSLEEMTEYIAQEDGVKGLNKILEAMKSAGLTANILTSIRIILWMPILYLVYAKEYAIAGVIYFLGLLTDLFDGPLARFIKHGVTGLGKLLDPFADKLFHIPLLVYMCWPVLAISSLIMASIDFITMCLAIIASKENSKGSNSFGKWKYVFQAVCIIMLFFDQFIIAELALKVAIIYGFFSIYGHLVSCVENYPELAKYTASIFSCLNALCGFIMVFFASYGIQGITKYLVFTLVLGSIFDKIDGIIARKFGSIPEGTIIDSIADAITFGVAPAAVLINYCKEYALIALAVGVFYAGCAIYRLVRFTKTEYNPNFFEGLPSPLAALVVVSPLLFNPPAWIVLVAGLVAGYLMITKVPYLKFDKIAKVSVVVVGIIYFMPYNLVLYRNILFVSAFAVYTISGFFILAKQKLMA